MFESSLASEPSRSQSDLLHTFREKKKTVIPKIDLNNYRTKAALGQRVYDSLELSELDNKIDPHGNQLFTHTY